jgi:hypothetical protein
MSAPGIERHWDVIFHDEFVSEYRELSTIVQDGLIALATNLGERGPQLGRPEADTLKGSRHANMKELRFNADGGVWRVAFAFDLERKAILLVAGDKGWDFQTPLLSRFDSSGGCTI